MRLRNKHSSTYSQAIKAFLFVQRKLESCALAASPRGARPSARSAALRAPTTRPSATTWSTRRSSRPWRAARCWGTRSPLRGSARCWGVDPTYSNSRASANHTDLFVEPSSHYSQSRFPKKDAQPLEAQLTGEVQGPPPRSHEDTTGRHRT